jgi:hypothetical protein
MIDGEAFSMRQHGFARNKQFSVVGASASGCSFRLEPWQGYAAPLGFAGELKDKPGGVLLAANASTEFTIEICLLGANEPSA